MLQVQLVPREAGLRRHLVVRCRPAGQQRAWHGGPTRTCARAGARCHALLPRFGRWGRRQSRGREQTLRQLVKSVTWGDVLQAPEVTSVATGVRGAGGCSQRGGTGGQTREVP